MTLTPRDKKLLQVILIIAIAVLPAVILFQTAFAGYQQEQQQLAELVEKLDQHKQVVDKNLPLKDQLLAVLRADLQEKLPNTEEYKKAYNAQYLFVDILQRNGLYVSELLISQPELVTVAPTADDYALFGNEEVEITEEDIASIETPDALTAKRISINMTVSGAYSGILRAVDEINAFSKYIIIDKFAVDDMLNQSNTTGTLGVSIYFVETSGTAQAEGGQS